MIRRKSGRSPRRGFTLVETSVVSSLMVLLAMVLSMAWKGAAKPTGEAIASCRLAQQIRIALDCFARDLGGSLPEPAARAGNKQQGKFVGWLLPSSSQLWLCFDSQSSPNGVADWGSPDTVIVYMLQGNSLLRCDQTANTTFAVANYVEQVNFASSGQDLQIELVFSYRDITRTCTLLARAP
jgi:prepilin-type N-terminal cleavage/methylation domain-containing protein